MTFTLPEKIEFVLNKLIENGYSAYIVGGCVRDLLCGKVPSDYDITTSANPDVIKELFEKTLDTGIKHGTITVIIDHTPIEVTTFRTEGGYADSRHPDSVNFVSCIEDDLARRDFTVNAMCYNKNEGIIDLFGGKQDIQNRILRAVGQPTERFCEDALRILRLFRFSATLNFDIEKSTLDAAIQCAHLLDNISSERVLSELTKISGGSNIKVIYPLIESGALKKYALEGKETKNLPNLEGSNNFRLFAFLYTLSNNLELTIDALKCSNKFKDYARKMQILCSKSAPENDAEIKRMLKFADFDIAEDALNFQECFSGINNSFAKERLRFIKQNSEPYLVRHLDITGKDIEQLGFLGEAVGEKLNFLLECVIENPQLNQREKLIKLICN